MIKPCIGLTPEKTAELAYEAAVGGVDVIKDDELVCDPDFCRLNDRVKAVMEALKRADEEKGEKTPYAFNITAPAEQMKENAYRALEAGANALMINYAAVGLDTVRLITEDPDINVPILAHSDYTGAQYESPWSGVSATLIGAKLPKTCRAGYDHWINAIWEIPYDDGYICKYGTADDCSDAAYQTGISNAWRRNNTGTH
ncbi:MAG: RuBisCO large subunit C-terminal-like domain-containing protein [[Ruminococcus] torques]